MLHNETIYIEPNKYPLKCCMMKQFNIEINNYPSNCLHNKRTIYIEPNKYPLKCCIMKEQFILNPISTH